MENSRENRNFVEFGLFWTEEADILKRELEKKGVPVKILYPGTYIGKEYFGVYFSILCINGPFFRSSKSRGIERKI